MPSPIEVLQGADFSPDEITAWSVERRKTLTDAGFKDNEIDAYFTGGVVAPTGIPRAFEDRIAAGDEAAKREGGLLQTVPQFASMIINPEGRGRLWEAVKQFPSKFLTDMIETAAVPGDVASGKIDLSTEDGIDRALGLGTLIGLGRFSKINQTGKTSGLSVAMGDQVARVERSPIGEVFDQAIGGLPTSEDFVAASKSVTDGAAPMAVQEKLLNLYEDHGRLPAEVVHDAQTDPVIHQQLLSKDPRDIPYEGVAEGDKGPPLPPEPPPPPEPPLEGSFEAAQQKILDKISVGERDTRGYSLRQFYRDFVDDLHPLKAVEQQGYEAARLTRGDFGKAGYFLETATFDHKTLRDNGAPLSKILEPVRDDLNGWRAYAAARRAIEIEETGRKSGFDVEAARKVVDDNPKAATYKKVTDEVVAYNNRLLSYLRDSGVLSDRSFDAMVEAGKSYVPFYRLIQQTAPKQRGSSLGPGDPIKRLKGSERETIDPLESIIKNTYAYISIAERNAAGIKIVEALEKEGLKAKSTPTGAGSELFQYLKENGVSEPETLGDFVKIAAPEAGDTLSAFRDGKRVEVAVDDPELVKAYKALDRESAGIIEKVLSLPASWLRAGAVLSPDFIARNPVRDFFSAFVFSTRGLFTPVDTFKGLTGVLRRDADWQDWVKSGGSNAAFVSLDRRYMQESLERLTADTGLMTRAWNVAKTPFTPLRMLSELMENSTRLGEFKKAIKNIPVSKGQEPERVVGAAVQAADGRVFIGPNHIIAMDEARKVGADYSHVFEGREGIEVNGGFFTSKGRYVSRQEAADIANKTGEYDPGPEWLKIAKERGVLAEALSLQKGADKQFISEQQGQVPRPGKEALQAAAYASREVTLDFARLGAKMRGVNMIVAFANAQVQGVDRLGRAFIDRPVNTSAKILAGITLPSALLWWANHDDPRYQELPDWQKDLFWIVPTDKWEPISAGDAAGRPAHLVRQRGEDWEFNNGTIWRIPKPFEMGVIFGSGVERALSHFADKDPEAFRGFTKSVMEALLPSVIPTAALPVVEQWANRSTFTDRTLIPADMEGKLPAYQYTPYTTELSKKLGRLISAFPGVQNVATEPGNIFGPAARGLTSPILVENYVRAWSGGLGMYAVQAADSALRKVGVLPDPIKPTETLADIPFIKAFVVRYPSASAESIQAFHDQYQQSKRFFDTWMVKAREGDVVAMGQIQEAGGPMMFAQLDVINQTLSEHSKLIKDIYKNPEMPSAEKRQFIDSLYFSMLQIAQGGRQIMRQVKKEPPP